MKRPTSIRIDATLMDAVVKLIKSNEVKYRSFTFVLEQALSEYLIKEKDKQNEKT